MVSHQSPGDKERQGAPPYPGSSACHSWVWSPWPGRAGRSPSRRGPSPPAPPSPPPPRRPCCTGRRRAPQSAGWGSGGGERCISKLATCDDALKDYSKLVSCVWGVILQLVSEVFTIEIVKGKFWIDFCNISLSMTEQPAKCTKQGIYQQTKIVGNSFRLFDKLLMCSNLSGSILPIVRI